jgi:ArsR family transcriptional regulator
MSNYGDGDIEQTAAMFAALSNPYRLKIFLRLASCCTSGSTCTTEEGIRECIGELGKNLEIAPSTVSHHIKELCRAGLIRAKRRGQNVICWVEPETLDSLATFFKLPANA